LNFDQPGTPLDFSSLTRATYHGEVVAILNALPNVAWYLSDQTKIANLCIGRAQCQERPRITVEIAADNEGQVVSCEVVYGNVTAYDQGSSV
jgi:hypothetical protein